MVAASSGWEANTAYLRREIERAMVGLALVVRPTKRFHRWKPEENAKNDIRQHPGSPRLFEVGEFPYTAPVSCGSTTDLHVINSRITVWYPIGASWENVVVSDYRVIRDYLLGSFRAAITMPDLSYCILDALEMIEPERVDEPRGQWIDYPLQTAVYITGG